MRRSRSAFGFLLASGVGAAAQGFTPPPQAGGTLPALGGLGGPMQLGPPATMPAPPVPQGQAVSADPGRSGPGFGAPAAPPAALAPGQRQNYADELTDLPSATRAVRASSRTMRRKSGRNILNA